jgi:hypothetical protein
MYGFSMGRSDIVAALTVLVEALVEAGLGQGTRPDVFGPGHVLRRTPGDAATLTRSRKISGGISTSRKRDSKAHLSETTSWPFDGDGALRPRWEPPEDVVG